MKIAIVGASGAGLYLALFIKKNHPEFAVTLFDKNEKIGRKLLATGNGHANVLNMKTGPEHFNHPSFVAPYLNYYPFGECQGQLASEGIVLKNDGDLLYPLSFSAPSYVSFLGKLLKKEGVEIKLGVKVSDYVAKEKITLYTDKGEETFDFVVFATGGCSQAKLGSDGSLFPVFKKHGYKVVEPRPGLCPIRTVEKTKALSGQRHEAKVTVTIKGIVAREEEGEVLFKDDGLSGIVIFNIASFINHLDDQQDVSIYLDLFPKVTLTALTMDLFASMKTNPDFFMDAYLTEPLKEYILRYAGVRLDGKVDKGVCFKIAKVMKQLPFRFKETYGFDNSQVTIGGISVENVGEKLRSKIENNVAFAGEVLDVDGLCGGHNLTWCLVSALAIAESF